MHNFHHNYHSQSWGVHIIHVNWSACQFPKNDKWDRSSAWRSANSTHSAVGLCIAVTWCWQHAHVKFQLNILWHQCDSQLLSPSLTPFAGESAKIDVLTSSSHQCDHDTVIVMLKTARTLSCRQHRHRRADNINVPTAWRRADVMPNADSTQTSIHSTS